MISQRLRFSASWTHASGEVTFPVTAFLTSLFGILITAATADRYGEAIWNPPDLLLAAQKAGGSGSRASTFFCAFAWTISQLGINIPRNLVRALVEVRWLVGTNADMFIQVAGGVDVAALWPKYINLRRGAYFVLIVSLVVNPWQLLSSSSIFLEVLSAYSVFLSPMTGLVRPSCPAPSRCAYTNKHMQLVSQYYLIQKRYFKIPDLYIGDKRSIYWYSYGINWRAFAAFFSGVAPCITGFVGSLSNHRVSAAATHIYNLNYVVGFAISFVVNWALHYAFPVAEQREFVRRMEEVGAPKHIDGIIGYLEDPDRKSTVDTDDVNVIEDMVGEAKSLQLY